LTAARAVAVPPKKSGSGLRPEDLREKESVAGTLVPAPERRERQYWLDRERFVLSPVLLPNLPIV